VDGQGREGEGQGEMRRGRNYVGEEEENGRRVVYGKGG